MFDLERAPGAGYRWVGGPGRRSCLIGQIWSDIPEEYDDRGPRAVGSRGWRVWMRREDLQAFLTDQQMDLLYEVEIERRLHEPYNRGYDQDWQQKRKIFHRILLCRQDGRLEAVSGCIGSWTKARPRA